MYGHTFESAIFWHLLTQIARSHLVLPSTLSGGHWVSILLANSLSSSFSSCDVRMNKGSK